MSVVVQTSSSESNLPTNAILAKGAVVNSVTPVSGSNGQLFSVDLTTNPNARSVAVSTIAGITLANGLKSLGSNTLNIDIATANPQVNTTSQHDVYIKAG